MLPRLPLDDRTFADLIQEMRQGIPHRLPEWTDENAHDPGITFLELFAWLSEMQQFYLSRIPERNIRKFLALLGIDRREAQLAETIAAIGGVTQRIRLPIGTKLLAEDQMFETVEPVRLLPLAIERIITRTEREASDRTAASEAGNSSFYAFGPDARAGSTLYISLDRAPDLQENISLSVLLADGAGGTASEAAANISGVVPSVRVSWKAYCIDDTGSSAWMPILPVVDETLHLSYSGRLSFMLERPLQPVIVHPAADKARYWISCTLEEAGYERPPRINRLLLNTVQVKQQDTHCEKHEYDSPGNPGFSIATDGYLARYGKLRVQVREADGRWREWRVVPTLEEAGPLDRWCTVERLSDPDAVNPVVIRFGDGQHGAVPAAGNANIRLIHYEETFEPLLAIGRSNGLPAQTFELPDISCRQSSGLLIQVGLIDEASKEMVWEDWQPVSDFDRSGPLDRHYIYDPDRKLLTFGDDEHGAIPAVCETDNLVMMSCVTSGGERGNIKPGLLKKWVEPQQQALGLTVTNVEYASGGSEAESLTDCLLRTESEWGRPYCAVSNEDYEHIARSTPGLRVARVHVIPGYAPGRPQAPAAVTVVVVPEGASRTPMPSQGFMETVARHLDERRLLTTEVHVIAPSYIQISVHATVVVEPHFMEEAHRVVQALNRLLSPLDRPKEGLRGWPFGRMVSKGDIYGLIAGIKGVAYVQDLWMDAEGTGARKNAAGDIWLPPNGLVYSGAHEIEFMSSAQM